MLLAAPATVADLMAWLDIDGRDLVCRDVDHQLDPGTARVSRRGRHRRGELRRRSGRASPAAHDDRERRAEKRKRREDDEWNAYGLVGQRQDESLEKRTDGEADAQHHRVDGDRPLALAAGLRHDGIEQPRHGDAAGGAEQRGTGDEDAERRGGREEEQGDDERGHADHRGCGGPMMRHSPREEEGHDRDHDSGDGTESSDGCCSEVDGLACQQ